MSPNHRSVVPRRRGRRRHSGRRAVRRTEPLRSVGAGQRERPALLVLARRRPGEAAVPWSAAVWRLGTAGEAVEKAAVTPLRCRRGWRQTNGHLAAPSIWARILALAVVAAYRNGVLETWHTRQARTLSRKHERGTLRCVAGDTGGKAATKCLDCACILEVAFEGGVLAAAPRVDSAVWMVRPFSGRSARRRRRARGWRRWRGWRGR